MNAPLPSEPAQSGRHELRRLAEEVGDVLAQRGETLAVGETAGGGALASALSAVAAFETRFRGGVVVYAGSDAPLARDISGVARTHGVVSEEYVAALARYVRGAFDCQWALAESGIAGPQTGRRSAKPVGMVCLAVAGPVEAGTSAQERGTSPRATEGLESEAELARGRGTSPRATAEVHDGRERVWTSTLLLPDGGRGANQRQFAVESLRLLRCVLQARDRE